MSKTASMTSQFNYGDKENQENQINQSNQTRQKQTMKEEKGVETDQQYPINPQTNIVYAAATSTTQDDDMAFEKMQGILKKFKDEDDQKINSLNQSINEKINQIMSVNNETARKVNDLEHKVEAYTLTASRISRSHFDLTHEEHHHEEEVPIARVEEEQQDIFRKSPMKETEGRYREQADYPGSGDVLEPREEEEEDVVEREQQGGDLNIVELEEVHEEKEQEQEKENKPVEVIEENEGHFTQDKRDRIAAYNRLYHIDEQAEEEPVEAVEPVKEIATEEDVPEVIRQEFNAGEFEDDVSERRVEPKRNEKIRIEDQEEEIDENKSIPLRRKTPSYPVATSNYNREREDIQELEEEHHEEEQLPYEDEDERERTMRVIESSMGIRGDEDKQIERDRKEYLKAKETMDQKYLAEMMQPVDSEKVQEDMKGDLKHSFKNMFGSDFDLLAGKDMVLLWIGR